MDINNVCKNYFHVFEDLSHWKTNTAKKNTLTCLSVLLEFTIFSPISLTLGIIYGISYLIGRVKKIVNPNASINKVSELTKRFHNNGTSNEIEKDFKNAVYWYKKAAEEGYAEAQYDLGIMYDVGQGVKQDLQKAANWYEKSAKQGHKKAQYNLGIMYDVGQGVKQDLQKAVYWYQQAAKQGHKEAQYNLAEMYDTGQGVKQDPREAIHWYQKAAEQGHKEAQGKLKNRQTIQLITYT